MATATQQNVGSAADNPQSVDVGQDVTQTEIHGTMAELSLLSADYITDARLSVEVHVPYLFKFDSGVPLLVALLDKAESSNVKPKVVISEVEMQSSDSQRLIETLRESGVKVYHRSVLSESSEVIIVIDRMIAFKWFVELDGYYQSVGVMHTSRRGVREIRGSFMEYWNEQ